MIQTSLVIDGSAVMGLPRPELPPTAHLGLRPYLSTFVNDYLRQSPLALLSVVVARDGIAHLASPLSTSEESILADIETKFFLINPPTGMMSLENSLRVALASLEVDVDRELAILEQNAKKQAAVDAAKMNKQDDGVKKEEGGDRGDGTNGAATSATSNTATTTTTSSCQRRIVVVTGSVSVLDPGNVQRIIRDVCVPTGVIVDVVSLTGAPYILSAVASLTGGQFHCPLSGGGEHLLKIMETVAALRTNTNPATEGAIPTASNNEEGEEDEGLSTLLGNSSGEEGGSSTTTIGSKRQRSYATAADQTTDNIGVSMIVSMGLPQSLYTTNVDHTSTANTDSSSSLCPVLPQSLGLVSPPPSKPPVVVSSTTTTPTPALPISAKTSSAMVVDSGSVLPEVRCPRCASVVSLPSVCPVCCLIVSSLPLMHTTYLTMNKVVPETRSTINSIVVNEEVSPSSLSTKMMGVRIASKLVVRCSMCGGQGVDGVVRSQLVESISATTSTTTTSGEEGNRRAQCLAVLMVDRLGLTSEWVFCRDCGGRRCEECQMLVKKEIGLCPTCL